MTGDEIDWSAGQPVTAGRGPAPGTPLARYHEALHAGSFGVRADPDDVHRVLVHR